VLAASIIRAIMEAAGTYETSVNFYQTTRRSNPEDSHLHTRRRENLKSHFPKLGFHILKTYLLGLHPGIGELFFRALFLNIGTDADKYLCHQHFIYDSKHNKIHFSFCA
jgi:hypothetical protein